MGFIGHFSYAQVLILQMLQDRMNTVTQIIW